MEQYPLLELHLRSLRLPTMLANYKRLAGDITEPISYLTQLASLEADKRHENGVRARIAAAHFPVIKTIESFDFSSDASRCQRWDRLKSTSAIFAGSLGCGQTLYRHVGPNGKFAHDGRLL